MLPKYEWIGEFGVALRDVRPDLSVKFAAALAVNEWGSKMAIDPVEAAEGWAKRSNEVKPIGKKT